MLTFIVHYFLQPLSRFLFRFYLDLSTSRTPYSDFFTFQFFDFNAADERLLLEICISSIPKFSIFLTCRYYLMFSNHWEDLRELVEHWSPTFICYPVVRFSDTELLYMYMFDKIYSCSKFQPLKITRLLSTYCTGRCPRCWIWLPFSILFRFKYFSYSLFGFFYFPVFRF